MILLNNKEIEPRVFPDGTYHISVDLTNEMIYESAATISWFYDSENELSFMFYLTRHLQDNGIKDIDLILPYVPNARQDRVRENSEVFTLKYFCEIINFLNFNKVFILDPHSPVTPALLKNVVCLSPCPNIAKVINEIDDENLLLFYPDEGSMKRYSDFLKREYAFGIKERDWKTGKILGLNIGGCAEKIKNSNILIVDDICGSGDTFYYAAKLLKENGAKDIYLYATHCENRVLKERLLGSGLIKKLYTTNSIYRGQNDLIKLV